MKKKELLVLGSKKYPTDTSLYEVNEYKDIIDINYSSLDKGWMRPGSKAYTLKNNGDGFLFTDHSLNKQIPLTYCQAHILRAMLKIEDGDSTFNRYVLEKK